MYIRISANENDKIKGENLPFIRNKTAVPNPITGDIHRKTNCIKKLFFISINPISYKVMYLKTSLNHKAC